MEANRENSSRNHDSDQPGAGELPYRVGDHDNQSWHGGTDADLGCRVAAYDFNLDLPSRAYENLLPPAHRCAKSIRSVTRTPPG